MPRRRLFIITAWMGIGLLALFLRLHDLGDRPIHADEATGARLLAQRLEGEGYAFNPSHHHGPFLSLSSVPIAYLRGERSWEALSILTLRFSPVLAGVLLVLTPLLWRRELGDRSVAAAAALLATSPLLVYYNRMYIHESWLALFGILACAAVYRLAEKPSLRRGLLAGFCLGLMYATRETFAISVLAWSAALGICFWKPLYPLFTRSTGVPRRIALEAGGSLLLAAALTAAAFYSNGFRSPQGVVDAVRTFLVYETTAGHEKGFFYYVALLLWPKHLIGFWWSEALVGILAVIAVILAARPRASRRLPLFLALTTLIHLLVYSSIGYKTPWLMMLPWAHACLLAGCALGAWPTSGRRFRIVLAMLLIGGVVFQSLQSLRATGRFSNDARNPYAYVPTSRDAPRIERWLRDLSALPDAPDLAPVAIVGQEFWPLPWYLRSFEAIAYLPSAIEGLADFPLIFAMPAQVASCDALLEATHVKLPRGLRTHVSVTLYLRQEVWAQWIESEEP